MKNKRGFTLVESLVAIAIILASITGAFSVAQVGLGSSNLAKERVIAYFLAQETIENVKSARDHNNLERYKAAQDDPNPVSSPTWLEGILENGLCETDDPCDWSMILGIPGSSEWVGEFMSCDEDLGGCVLYLDNNGIYNYVSQQGGQSQFTRKLTIEETEDDVEAKVSVTVSWRNGSQSVKIEENIYNWSVPATL